MNAIILAGGKGSRLQPWHAPKCLLPINGVPMLHRIMRHLDASVEHTVICAGYRASDVKASLDRFEHMSFGISNAGEDAAMGTRLLTARKFTDSLGRVIICYGDELVDIDISLLLQAHTANSASLTFVAAKTRVPGGAVVEDPYEENVGKRTVIVEDQARWVNVGYAIVERECWLHLEQEDGLSDWINRVSRELGHVFPFYFEGKRATVNSLADLQYAEQVWK